MPNNYVMSAKNLSKQYNQKDAFVLMNVSLALKKSEFIALLGPSGSGKSTLLHIMGLLDDPTDGEIIIDGTNIQNLSDNEKTFLRLSQIGFVYQYHHLLHEFSALENVMLPQLLRGIPKKEAKEKSENLLGDLGLKNKLNSFPSELSGGQKQRIAIARAVANDPMVLLADEPTGNLDPETAALVFDDLMNLMKKNEMSAIIATHNYELANKMDRKFLISEGRLQEK